MTSEQFNSSYLSLAPTLYKVAFYILESEEEARDAVQDAFVAEIAAQLQVAPMV